MSEEDETTQEGSHHGEETEGTRGGRESAQGMHHHVCVCVCVGVGVGAACVHAYVCHCVAVLRTCCPISL